MDPDQCWGSNEQNIREKIRLKTLPLNSLNSQRNKVDPGPRQVVTSLKGLQEIYESKPAWKVIEEGGVLSIPVEEFMMIDPQKPENFGKARGKKEQR